MIADPRVTLRYPDTQEEQRKAGLKISNRNNLVFWVGLCLWFGLGILAVGLCGLDCS